MELSDLHGELSLENLQNVESGEDASEANLMEKQYLEELKLYWSGDTDDSKHDKNVLDKLQPHTNLKRIYIHRYGGTTFPKWLGDGSFCNIIFLLLSDCKFCACLPTLGQLSSLKNLEIEGLDGIVSVGAELYGMDGTSCTRMAFPSLESLRFSKMSNWEEWCSSIAIEDGEVFPKLQELIISDCDRLISIDLSHNLPSLTKLRIDGDEVVVSSLPRTPTLRQLMLGGRCEKLELQKLPQTMETIAIGNRYSRAGPNCLEILNCEKVEFPLTHHSLRRSSIQEVYVVNSCGSLESFPLDFFPCLRHLSIEACKNLVSLTVTKSDEQDVTTTLSLSTLSIQECPCFVCFPNGRLHAPNLTELKVIGCKKLKKLPDQMHNLLPSLKCLFIDDCPEVESFPEGGLPSNLALLWIRKCSKLIAQRKKWELQKLQALVDFHILIDSDDDGDSGGEGVECFPEEGLLPSTLTSLHIYGCASLNRLDIKGLQQLTSLQRLCVSQHPQLSQSLPQLHASFPPSRIGERSPALEEAFCNHISHIPHSDIDFCREFKPKSPLGRK
ncbi:putative disease resistance protein At3g14460 [Ziziphus jujuba]|uniref:Disease resistance protein At3g14460 n=1 Tax=Ziziphus jujuba TaxID=326968 RepID=A0A6P4AHC3_ZIZJJ|nr:putative disease resistance protein At3g14460 [Ziziphus jujuba]